MGVALCRRHLRPQPETPHAIPLPQQKNDSAGNAPETVILCHLGLEEFVTDHRCIVSHMASLRIRNGYAAVVKKHGSVGRTMSQHAIWRITMHFGNALISATRSFHAEADVGHPLGQAHRGIQINHFGATLSAYR